MNNLKNSDFKIFVLDTSSFYSGYHLSCTDSKFYISSEILNEVSCEQLNFETSIRPLILIGRITVLDSSSKHKNIIKSIARKSGDIFKLSNADLSIVSLAYQLKSPLVSSDYPIQNICTLLNIPIISIGVKEINQARKWVTICRTCGKSYSPQILECYICGNKTTRRYKNQRSKNKNSI
ncbi:MAG: NOB1 family endonuclease [Nitrososphaeraceae archaeon]